MPNQTRKDMVSLVNWHHNAKIINMHDSVATKVSVTSSLLDPEAPEPYQATRGRSIQELEMTVDL